MIALGILGAIFGVITAIGGLGTAIVTLIKACGKAGKKAAGK